MAKICTGRYSRLKQKTECRMTFYQNGTVTETIDAVVPGREPGWGFVIFHNSGETKDAFMADFAAAMGGGQIKTGSACRSERIAKYNRLLEIEYQLGNAAIYGR